MFESVKNSVTRTVAKALGFILVLSVVTTSFAIVTLASSLDDAEAVNVAGSMRMQSYRLAYDILSSSADYETHIVTFERSIYSSSMKALQNWNTPDDIIRDYDSLSLRWQKLKQVLRSDEREQYLILVGDFVDQIDTFVYKLQSFSELKMIKLAWVGGFSLAIILIVSLFVVQFIRRQIVRPLNALVDASEQIKAHSFDIKVNVSSDNEMGILTHTFNTMAADLGKFYRGLEQAVHEKTQELQHANDSLKVLYQSSQELTASRIGQDNFEAILTHIVSLEGISSVRLEVLAEGERSLVLTKGEECSNCAYSCQSKSLSLDGIELGTLYLKVALSCTERALIDNFVQILSRAIYYNQAQRQSEQLLLMEERATIARELHDSLAQSLSYLKIQVSLLKRSIATLPRSQALNKVTPILAELDTGLSSAYTQLRELLTTFRLSIKEGSFGNSLAEMMEQLSERTEAKITLSNQLSSVELDANQQVHLLQLIREATINSIKHAHAKNIDIRCLETDTKIIVSIYDDGIGFDPSVEKLNHYGMSIMKERAFRLTGTLTVISEVNKGCKVVLEYPKIKETNVDRM